MEWSQWLSHILRVGGASLFSLPESPEARSQVLVNSKKSFWGYPSRDISTLFISFHPYVELLIGSFPSLGHCVSFLTAPSLFSFYLFLSLLYFIFWLCCVKRQRNQRSNYHLLEHQKSNRVPEKHLLPLYWLCQSLWLCGSQQTQKFWKRWEYETTWPASWEICMQVKKQQLEPDMGQWADSRLGKEYVKAVYLSSCLLNL